MKNPDYLQSIANNPGFCICMTIAFIWNKKAGQSQSQSDRLRSTFCLIQERKETFSQPVFVICEKHQALYRCERPFHRTIDQGIRSA